MEQQSAAAASLNTENIQPTTAIAEKIDIPAHIIKIKEQSAQSDKDITTLTLFKADKLRIVLVMLKKNGMMNTHHTPALINVRVIEGPILFTADGTVNVLNSEQVFVLGENIPHSVEAVEESIFLLTVVMP